jgi:hypothetical protein
MGFLSGIASAWKSVSAFAEAANPILQFAIAAYTVYSLYQAYKAEDPRAAMVRQAEADKQERERMIAEAEERAKVQAEDNIKKQLEYDAAARAKLEREYRHDRAYNHLGFNLNNPALGY